MQLQGSAQQNRSKKKSLWKSYLKTVFSLPFMGSLLLVLLFFAFSKQGLESQAQFIWIALRPFAVLFVIVFLFPLLPVEKLGNYLSQTRFHKIASTLKETQNLLKEMKI